MVALRTEVAANTVGERVETVTTATGDVEVHVEWPKRVRSASDVLRLLVGLLFVAVGLVLATLADDTVGGAQADLVEAVAQLPSPVEQAAVGIAQLLTSSVIGVISLVLIFQRRWRRLLVLMLGSVTAAVTIALLGRAFDLPETARAIEDFGVRDGWFFDPSFPSASYLASAATVVTLASVWLSRRWKRALWFAVAALALLRALSSATSALDVVLAIAVGVVVGSLALVAFGAPNRAPEAEQLVGALREVVPDLRTVRSGSPLSGSHSYHVTTASGHELFVKMRTPDDRSADYLARLYRRARLRSGETAAPYATVQRQIEHEALALVRADAAGVAVPELVGIGATDEGSALFVTERVVGRALAEIPADELDRCLLDGVWTSVGALHAARIAHRNLALENVIVDTSGRAHLVDFDDAEIAARPRAYALDVAQLLVETSLLAGPEVAVEAAKYRLGLEPVRNALPLLQPLALPAPIRRRLRKSALDLDDLRRQVREQTKAEDVPLERLERVRPRTIVSIVALTAAFYFLLPQLANIGDTWEAFRRADWQWIPVILVGSALTYLFAAVSFVGSVSDPVPFGAALLSRVASSFVSSITPAGTGGLALGVRVLQRVGIDPAAATASVGINAVAGLAVHIMMLLVFVSWTGASGVGGFSLPDSTILLLGLSIVLAVSGVALLIRRIRDLVVQPVLRGVRAAASEIAGVFRSPLRVAELIGGSAATTLAYMLALTGAVQAFGGGVSFPQIGAAYLVASAIGSAAPTPGGLGAVEAALVAGLTGFGMENGPAVSAVLSYRLATYWLPTLPGWFAFRWMQAREEI